MLKSKFMSKKFLFALILLSIIGAGIIAFIIIKNRTLPIVSKVADNQILFPTLSNDQKYIFYFSNANEAAFYRLELQNQKIEKISEDFDTPDRIIWSPSKNQAILQVTYNKYIFEKYGSPFIRPGVDDQAITFWLYDLNQKKLSPLDLNIRDIIWSKDGQKIVSSYYDEELNHNIINISDPDGTNLENLIKNELPIEKVISYEPANKKLIFGASTPGELESRLDIYQVIGSGTPTLIIEAVEPGGIYASSNMEHLVSIIDGVLNISNLTQNKTQSLKIKTNKNLTVWLNDNQNLIVATRQETTKTDTFYKINSQTLKKNMINHKGTVDIQNLILSSDQKTLYFTSDDILYKLELK